MAIKRDAAFESFVSTAQSMLGNDLSEDWLFEIWVGADADANRALNHVLDSPEDKIRRSGGGGHKSSSEAKTPKKSKPPRESKPAPATPATTWGDDDDYVPPQRAQPPQQHYAPPPPAPQQQPPQQQYPGYPQQPGYGPQPGYQPTQPMPYGSQLSGFAPQPMGYPQSQPGMSMQNMMNPMMPPTGMMGTQPMMAPAPMMPNQPSFMIDPMTGLPIAPMTPIQQAQAMFVQQQQQQRLMMLKMSIDSVLSNPTALTNPQIMQNLQDTMIQALEAPNATLQMAERARQSQQTAQFIQIMQGQVAQMLSDPKVATNPALLQQLNNQMNQLRLLTMQHVAQQQIDANPATALSSLNLPLIAPPSPSASILNRALLSQSRLGGMPTSGNLGLPFDESVATGVPMISLPKDDNEDWWSSTPKASKSSALSEKNPFRDNDTETTPTNSRFGSMKQLSRTLSNPNVLGMPMLGSMNALPMSMPSMTGMPLSNPNLAMMYGNQQPGYNPILSLSQQNLAAMNNMMYPSYRQF
jgi:hypothetical protein